MVVKSIDLIYFHFLICPSAVAPIICSIFIATLTPNNEPETVPIIYGKRRVIVKSARTNSRIVKNQIPLLKHAAIIWYVVLSRFLERDTSEKETFCTNANPKIYNAVIINHDSTDI